MVDVTGQNHLGMNIKVVGSGPAKGKIEMVMLKVLFVKKDSLIPNSS